MYCLTVTYPKSDETMFDFNYYENSHVPLVKEKYGPFGLQNVVYRKEGGSKPGGDNLFYASADLVFDSLDNMKAALAAAGAEISADIANYTNAKPSVSFAEVVA